MATYVKGGTDHDSSNNRDYSAYPFLFDNSPSPKTPDTPNNWEYDTLLRQIEVARTHYRLLVEQGFDYENKQKEFLQWQERFLKLINERFLWHNRKYYYVSRFHSENGWNDQEKIDKFNESYYTLTNFSTT
jgi:hypothetical protein